MSEASQWCVVRTEPRRETWAQINVERTGCDTYLPMFRPVTPKLSKAQPRPLFPSYLFVDLKNVLGQWYFLLTTFGVHRPILCSGRPAEVPEKIINEIRRRQKGDGMIDVPSHRFDVGQKVRVKRGAFADQIGIFQGMNGKERVKVLFGMITATIADNLVEAA